MSKLGKMLLILLLVQSCSSAPTAPSDSNGVGNGLIALGDLDEQGQSQVFLVSSDGSDRRQLTHESGRIGKVWMPTWAPDGERLAYVVEHDQGMDIYSINVDGRERTKLTQTGVNMTPAWSPDGGFIAYASADCGNCAMHIWIMRSDGTEKHAITFGEHRENVPTWSPDGKHLAFTSNREGGLFQIWIVNLEDLSLTRLTNAYYNDNFRGSIQQKVPAWSPDGTTIAYWQGIEMDDRPEDPTLPREVWVMNADGSNPRALTSGDDPAWSADGTRIIFPACSDLGPFSRILSGEGCELAVAGIDLDGSNKRVLFLTNGWFGRASWQPFGKKE